MCVRLPDKQRITEAIHVGKLPDGFVLPDWDYNVAPATFQPVIRNARETGERELVLMRWGLVPHFPKFLADFKGISTINAKAETLMSSNTWRVPFQRGRCLVPADGFYEWKKLDPRRRSSMHSAWPMAQHSPCPALGCWAAGKTPKGCRVQSVTADGHKD